MYQKDLVIRSYRFNLIYAKALVDGVGPKMMTCSFGPGLENHAAFTLGHLCVASAMISEDIGGPYQVPEGWNELFVRKGPGDPTLPLDASAGYPTKEDLLSELEKQHLLVEKLINDLPPEELEKPFGKWRFSQYLPTVGDLVFFMCMTHESMHLGQLAGWRRAIGLPSALGAIR